MDEATVRDRLKKALGREPARSAWEQLVDGGYVDDIIRLGVIDDEAIEGLLRDYHAVGQSLRGQKRRPTEDRYELPGNDYLRVLSEAIADELASDPLVTAFRARYLADGLIEWPSFEGWVKRRASADGPPTVYAEIPLDAPNPIDLSRVTRRTTRMLEYAVPSPDSGSGGPALMRRVPTTRGGTLDRLRHAAGLLSALSGWPEAATSTFVVTEVPFLIPRVIVTTQVGTESVAQNRIILDLHPSTAPSEVLGVYRNVRREVGVAPKRAAKRPKDVIVRFVRDRPKLTWDELMDEWNRVFPEEWAYTLANNFNRDYHRAAREEGTRND